jgi:ParB family transcriptional regulator, chromosome partitioning protein
MIKKKGLGRGLEALLGESLDSGLTSGVNTDQIKFIKLTDLQRGKYQPRMQMKEIELQELSESIKQQGIMQPLLIRQISEGKYEIIAGERRFRAAGMAGLETVPALIKDVDDQTAAAMALIENMQRQDLNPLEEADGLARLISDFGFTHEQAAKVVGKSRSAVTNLLRLTQLSKPVQTLLMAGDIDMGHARAMLNVPTARQIGLAQRVAAQGLSVREAEKLANQIIQASKKNPDAIEKVKIVKVDPDIRGLQNRLSDLIGLDVEIKTKSKGGEIKIKFSHPDELDNLLKKLDLS